eukprot:14382974-Alexandrium_andersonii.AAC.1
MKYAPRWMCSCSAGASCSFGRPRTLSAPERSRPRKLWPGSGGGLARGAREAAVAQPETCLLYTSPSPRD